MSDLRTYDVLALSVALSPLTHNSGTEGNETLIQRESVIIDGREAWLPVLTGNALRHRMVRAPGARWLVERWGLAGKLSVPQLALLFNGGSLVKGAATESLARVREFWRIFPLGRVLGGCLPDLIVGGSLNAWRGLLVCRENAQRIGSTLPAGYEVPRGLLPAQRVVGRYQYVRNDVRRTAADLADQGYDGDGGQMIFSGQQVNAGAAFAHGFRLRDATTVDLGALLLSLAVYCAEVSTIGGMSARGHGRLETLVDCGGVDVEGAIRAYVDHVDSVREDAVAWFERELGVRKNAAKKGRAKSASKAQRKKDQQAAAEVEAGGLF